jgi:hypothetical protein
LLDLGLTRAGGRGKLTLFGTRLINT